MRQIRSRRLDVASAAALKRIVQHLESQADETTPAKRGERHWRRAEVLGLWVAAAVGVGAIWFANHDSGKQYEAMIAQQRIMEADQRPWLRVIVSIRDDVLLTEWNGTKQISIPLRFQVENFGKIPAVNVRAYALVLPYPGNPQRNLLSGFQKNTCEDGEAESNRDPIGGIAIFPSKADTIDLSPGALGGGVFDDGKPTMFAVLGCIDYTYSGMQHGQSGFRFLLAKQDRHVLAGIPFIVGTPLVTNEPIPKELLDQGYPKEPPNVARIPIADLVFRPEDSGNYAK